MSANIVALPQVTLGTGVATAFAAIPDRPRSPMGLWVQASYSNTVNIFVGDSAVIANGGVELAPGERAFIPSAPAEVFGFCATAGQKFSGILVFNQ